MSETQTQNQQQTQNQESKVVNPTKTTKNRTMAPWNLLITNKNKLTLESYLGSEEIKFYLFIYNKMDEKIISNGKVVPLFSKIVDGDRIVDRLGVKLEEKELATFSFVLEHLAKTGDIPDHLCTNISVNNENEAIYKTISFIHKFEDTTKTFGLTLSSSNRGKYITFFISNGDKKIALSMSLNPQTYPEIINASKKMDIALKKNLSSKADYFEYHYCPM